MYLQRVSYSVLHFVRQPCIIGDPASLPLPLILILFSDMIFDIKCEFENISGSDRPCTDSRFYSLLYGGYNTFSRPSQLDLLGVNGHRTDILPDLMGEICKFVQKRDTRCWFAYSVSSVRSTGLWSNDSCAIDQISVERQTSFKSAMCRTSDDERWL